MYQKPELERFGTLREVTANALGWGCKPDPGTDLASAFGCELNAAPGSHATCGDTDHS